MPKIIQFLIAVCAMCSPYASPAQDTSLSGTVTDSSDGSPLAGVIVELLDAGDKTLRYAMSSSDGHFALQIPAVTKDTRLRFSMMGYRKETIPVSGAGQPLRVALVPEPTQIREIQIKAPDIILKGDTLVYNVERYADVSDRSIEDVLKKLPGVEVSQSGQISYQGEAINKFYIEGVDMLDGRYGLATKNISHKDVQSVELMENHQPVRALEDIVHSDQAALNIRLKEDAKSRWVGTANAGAGYSPVLYDASLFAMRIAGGAQSMENIKAGNTGKNLAKENMRFSTYNIFNEMFNRSMVPDLIYVGAPSAPIDESRTRFDRSILASSTNAFKTGKDNRLDAEVNYYGERLVSAWDRYTEYFDDGLDDYAETGSFLSHTHDLSARITTEVNKPEFFLRSDIEGGLIWKDAFSRMGGSGSTLQDARLPSRQTTGRLQLVKRTGRRTFTVNSDNRYQSSPSTLLVERDDRISSQDASYSVVHSQNDISYGFGMGRWQLSGRAGFMIRYNTLESSLTGIGIEGVPVGNDLGFFQSRVFATPSAVYRKKRTRLTLTLPVNFRTYSYSDKSADKNRSKVRFSVDPNVAFRYEISAFLVLNSSASYSSSPVNEKLFYGGAIMRDHRNISVGNTLFDSETYRHVNASLSYRNPMKSIFISGTLTYTNGADMPLRARYSEDGFIITTYGGRKGSTGTWSGRFAVAKGFNSGRLTAGLDGRATSSQASMVLEQVKTPYRSRGWVLSPHFKGRIIPRLNAEYRLEAGRDVTELKNGSDKSGYYNASQSLTAVFSVTERLQLHGIAEHYFTDISGNGDRNLVLLDAQIRWKSAKGPEISCRGNNLLNNKSFNYSTLASLTLSQTNYAIRKRSVLLSVYFNF